MNEISIGCTGVSATRRRGVFAIDRGWNGYGWRCPDCSADVYEVDRYSSEETAAAGLRHHQRNAHPVSSVTP